MEQTPLYKLFPCFCEINSLGYSISALITHIDYRTMQIGKYYMQTTMIENGKQLFTSGVVYYDQVKCCVIYTDLYRAIDDGINPISYVKYIPYEVYSSDVYAPIEGCFEPKNISIIEKDQPIKVLMSENVKSLLEWEHFMYENEVPIKYR